MKYFQLYISGVYEFELLNSVVNIFHFKDQMISQGIDIEDDSLFVYGIMKIWIERVKGADFELVEGDFFKGRKNFHTWPYTLNKGDIICECGGELSFLNDFYASIIIVAEKNSKITLTFDYNETVPYDFTNAESTFLANLKRPVQIYHCVKKEIKLQYAQLECQHGYSKF